MTKNTLHRTSWKQKAKIIDTLNLLFFGIILLCAVLLLLNRKKFMIMFPVLFITSSFMNLGLGVKKYKMDAYASAIIQLFVGLFLLGFSIFSAIVILS